METFLFSVLIIAIALMLLSVNLILKKNGSFPNTHIEGNKAMEERGIHCAIEQDREMRNK